MKNTLLKNGTVIHADRVEQEDIIIQDETILKVGSQLKCDDANIIDCKEKLIFPGVIDPHTHMGIPIKDGYSRDDFHTGSLSALNGGVTTIIDFSILKKEQTLTESIETRKSLAKQSYIDYSLHCNITRFSKSLLDEIPELIENGIISFKVFTTYKEAGMMLSYDEIKKVARVISKYNGILMVHAEDDIEISKALSPIKRETNTDPYFHGMSRPDTAEEVAINHLVDIAIDTECKIYIVHLNSAIGLEVARRSDNIFVETCPHYLLLDESVYQREDGRMYVASPPVRKKVDQLSLWAGISNNDIHTLGTDHCPFNIDDKKENIPFYNIPNGMGGVETLFPIMLAQWLDRGLDLCKLVELTSNNPSRIFGLYPQKGSIESGSDADLIVVNPKEITYDWSQLLVSETDWNAFSGFKAVFPEQVWLKGRLVNINELRNESPKGRFISGIIR